MGRRLRQLAVLALLLAGLGCQHGKISMLQPKTNPPDPLLITKKPVEARTRGGDPLLAYDPAPPREPFAKRDTSLGNSVRVGALSPTDDSNTHAARP